MRLQRLQALGARQQGEGGGEGCGEMRRRGGGGVHCAEALQAIEGQSLHSTTITTPCIRAGPGSRPVRCAHITDCMSAHKQMCQQHGHIDT